MIVIALAATAIPAVFGLQLGAPVMLPECAHAEIGSGKRSLDLYDGSQQFPCKKLPGVESPAHPDTGGIVFPISQMPTILASPDLATTIVHDNLEAIYASTLSHNNAPEITRQLTDKFGAPTTSVGETTEVQKIAVPSVHVLWRRPGYVVDYRSISSDIDYGELSIETDKARALREAREKAATSQRITL